MNHSLFSADRATHYKIVAVALVAASVLVLVAIAARVAATDSTSLRAEAGGLILRAGKPAVTAASGASALR